MEPTCCTLSGSPSLVIRECSATERAAMMGSTKLKSLSPSSCDCSRHWRHTSSRATPEKGPEKSGLMFSSCRML